MIGSMRLHCISMYAKIKSLKRVTCQVLEDMVGKLVTIDFVVELRPCKSHVQFVHA